MKTVKTPPLPTGTEHPGDLLLPYAEDMLGQKEKQMVEDHLSQCNQCASELEELRETIALLGETKEAFCPEEWELYEFLRYGTDPEGLIERHLSLCPSCKETALILAESQSPERMSPQLWAAIQKRIPSNQPQSPVTAEVAESLLDRLYRMFRIPALAVGVAAAAVFAMVLLRSPEMPQSVVALSAVPWENAPKPKALKASAKRVALLLVLKGFEPPVSKEDIDSMYKTLAPSVEICDRFHIVPPRLIRESMGRSELRLSDTRDVVDALAKKLSISIAVIVTVRPQGDATTVDVEVRDTTSGLVTARKTETDVSRANLNNVIKESAFALLLQ